MQTVAMILQLVNETKTQQSSRMQTVQVSCTRS